MWLVQYAGTNAENPDEVMKVLKAKGIPFAPIGIRPFTTEIMGLDDVDLTGPVMAYGSCKMVKLVSELGLRPGVFFDYSTFNVFAWSHMLGTKMVNGRRVESVSDLRNQRWAMMETGKDMFCRPVMDLKQFSGGIKAAGVSWDDYLTEKLQGSKDNESSLVLLSTPKILHAEWRCFIVNRKLVTASQYRLDGELKPSPDYPKELEKFVDEIAAIWLPHDHCVMDVALIINDDYVRSKSFRVMEFNCINASGVYKADVEKLVDALNSLMV